ncbi:fimbrial protein [Chromobacterium alkanivorans]|uniref:fimbrial protein n=1 Tax=Chromobacterium alkanivorans TaxID=1071719 RepID=UPI001967C9A6|nr:fimbrial protein [Chromobacterium alkanivorans]MBN3006082.1 fimbrial protein [Chromobacterium alkanivorans]
MNTPPNRLPLLACLALLLALGSCSRPSHADCRVVSSTIVQALPDPLVIPYLAPAGHLIAREVLQTKITCDRNNANGQRNWYAFLSYGNTDNDSSSISGVRKTQTSGIGIRWINNNTHSGKSQTFSTTSLNNGRTNLRGMPLQGTITITDTFELVTTGPVTSGRLNPESYAVNYKNKKGGDHGQPLYTYTFNQPAIRVIGCSFRNASQTVRLPDVNTRDFAGAGRAGDKPFNIGLDCAPGTSVRAKLSDANALGAAGTLLSIAGGPDSAQGIGLELQRQGETGVYLLGTEFTSLAVRQQHALPMVVRYAASGPAIRPGLVNAEATVELSFD